MLDENGRPKKSGMTVSGLPGCLMVVFILIGSFGGTLYLIMQAFEELR